MPFGWSCTLGSFSAGMLIARSGSSVNACRSSLERYARQTNRLNEALALIGFALGGEPGARTALGLGLCVSPDTLLNRIRQVAAQHKPEPAVKILGVDDFAFRRGHHYGTILVDHERRRVIDLLPDREGKTLAAWLKTQPEITIISRDRAQAYQEGAAAGAPQAEQVADRWHLVHNLTETFEKLLQHHYSEIRKAIQDLNGGQDAVMLPPVVPTIPQIVPPTASEYMRSRSDQLRRQDFHAQRKVRYQEVKQLQAQGLTIVQTARHLGISYTGVKTFYEAAEYPIPIHPTRGSQVDRFADYLSRRWAEGCRNAAQLYRELSAPRLSGQCADAATVSDDVATRRVRRSTCRQTSFQITRPKVKLPSSRECVWLLLKEEKDLTTEEQQVRQTLLEQSAIIRQGRELVQDFRAVLATRKVEKLEEWMETARAIRTVRVCRIRLRCAARSGSRAQCCDFAVEQWSDRGPRQSPESDQADDVWPGEIRPSQSTSVIRSVMIINLRKPKVGRVKPSPKDRENRRREITVHVRRVRSVLPK